MSAILAMLNGKKTYILVALGCLAYVFGLTDTAPIDENAVDAKDLANVLWGLAIATLRSGVAKVAAPK